MVPEKINPFYRYDGLYGNYDSNYLSGCRNGFYGNSCEKTYLLDLFNELCIDCIPNVNSWRKCFSLSSCYCLNGALLYNDQQKIECDEYNEITSIKLSNMNLTGNLNDLTEFYELKLLDLSQNSIQMNRSINEFLPDSIKQINFEYNSVYLPANLFEINTTKFINFTHLYIDNSTLCGLYPQSWVRFSIYF